MKTNIKQEHIVSQNINILQNEKWSEELEKIEQMFGIDKERIYKMLMYLDFVMDRNKEINLTAVKSWDDAFEKHIIDSLSVIRLEEYCRANKILDVGTGAGFPGAILSIASPEKKFVLLDSTLKKLKVIDEFSERLSINNLMTVHARAEYLMKQDEYREKFDLVVSRAVANLSKLLSWTLPFLKKGGSLIAYKGENFQEEIEQAKCILQQYCAEVKRVENINFDSNNLSGHVLIVISKK